MLPVPPVLQIEICLWNNFLELIKSPQNQMNFPRIKRPCRPYKRWPCHQVVIVVQHERSDDWLSAQLRVLQDQKIVNKVLLLYNEPLSLDKTELEVTYRPAASSDPLECLIAVLADLEDEFILIAGSSCFYCDLSLLVNFAADKKAVLALQYADELRDEPLVGIDDNYQVTEYQSLVTWREGTRDSYFASGICYFKREVLEEAARNSVKTGLKDYYLRLIEQRQLFGLPLAGCYAKSDFTKTIAAFLKQPLVPALFLDKDGTLIKNSGYPSGPQIEIVPELVPLIANYQKEHFCLFIVTNQSGIARGKYEFDALRENLAAICGYYAKAGVKFTEVVYCPYLPEASLKRYCFDVLARKPYPGMFLKLGAKYRIDWYRSIMIGDNPLADRIRLPYLKTLIIGDDLKFPSF